MGQLLGMLGGGAQQSQGAGQMGPQQQPNHGASTLLGNLPGIMNMFKGINTKNQSNIAGQQMNLANAVYNPSNPLYQSLYGQERQNIQQTGAAQIAQAGNQNRLLSSMGRTPLFSPERNGEEAFRQGVTNQQGSDLQAQNATRGILQGGINALGNNYQGAQAGANNVTNLQYGGNRLAQGANNQTTGGFNDIASWLKQGGF